MESSQQREFNEPPSQTAEERRSGPEVGDTVAYVPHECHALDMDRDGNFPWVLGWKRIIHKPSQRGIEAVEEVEELSGKRIDDVLNALNHAPNKAEARKNLVFVRPARTWTARVRSVNDDGTVNLDVQAHNSGVTLHYDNVTLAQEEKAPHTCHRKG